MKNENGPQSHAPGRHKFVVIDDDPTGIQTVHGCLLITDVALKTVHRALDDRSDFFYFLANTRAHGSDEAKSIVENAARVIHSEALSKDIDVSFISRSDSTLRSHFPIEIQSIEKVLISSGEKPADAFFLIPAFFEGGRITKNDTHYMKTESGLVPTGETEFARDSVFAYSTSWLPGYIEEKAGVPSKQVCSISLEQIRGSQQKLIETLQKLSGGVFVVVNAESYTDLDSFCTALRSVIRSGKRFMFQSSSSFVKSVTETPDKELLVATDFRRNNTGGFGQGAIIVGSHVSKTTRQVGELLKQPGTARIEMDAELILRDSDTYLNQVFLMVEEARKDGKTPVAFTSRKELSFSSQKDRLKAGHSISQFLVSLSAALMSSTLGFPAFLIAKGGITSHDILKHGLKISAARVEGQVLPGVPALRIETNAGDMPYVIFPGNVGDDNALATVYRNLRFN